MRLASRVCCQVSLQYFCPAKLAADVLLFVHLAVEAFQSGNEDTVETAEAAEALLNIDSTCPLALDEKQLCE